MGGVYFLLVYLFTTRRRFVHILSTSSSDFHLKQFSVVFPGLGILWWVQTSVYNLSLSLSLSIIYPHPCLNHHNSSFFILAPSVTPFTFLCFYCFSPPPIYLNPPLKLRSRATNFPQALTENDYRERRTVITMYAPSGSVLPCAQEQFFAVWIAPDKSNWSYLRRNDGLASDENMEETLRAGGARLWLSPRWDSLQTPTMNVSENEAGHKLRRVPNDLQPLACCV